MALDVTPLERSLDDALPDRASPVDALAAARRLWLAGERVDMGALAAELGVSRATLYRWVGTRERLLGEVVWTLAEPAYRHARAAARGVGAAYVSDAIDRYMRGALEPGPLRRWVTEDPEYALKVLCSKAGPMQRRSIQVIATMLQEQVDNGHLDPPLQIDTLAYIVVRIVESFLYADVISGSEPDVDAAVDAVHALLSAPSTARRKRRP